MRFTIIGMSDAGPEFLPDLERRVRQGSFFAGGKRHRELVQAYLPETFRWVEITVPLEKFLTEVQTHPDAEWFVFASGDPWFFGIANTLKRSFPEAVFEVVPALNSLQLLAHRVGVNYGLFKPVSLTGRDWQEFDRALILGEPRLALLTDRKKTPASIARRMLDYGYGFYRMYVGQRLGGRNEQVRILSPEEAVKMEFAHPNCLLLEAEQAVPPGKGIPESAFEGLPGRPNMITKMPVRLATLAALQLHTKKVFWDVGACTGSVAIEARLHYPHLKVRAFEKREECKALIDANARRFQAPGIEVHIADYLEVPKVDLELPDAVFLGGYGGRMDDILNDVAQRMQAGGRLVFNSVSEESRQRFLHWCAQNHFVVDGETQLRVDDFNPITILSACKPDEQARVQKKARDDESA